jgi:hypothetical protein
VGRLQRLLPCESPAGVPRGLTETQLAMRLEWLKLSGELGKRKGQGEATYTPWPYNRKPRRSLSRDFYAHEVHLPIEHIVE